MSTTIADVLNIEPHEVDICIDQTVVTPVTENIEDTDFDSVRSNQYQLLDQGKAAINTAMRIAAESENPRAIEVLAMLLKNVSEMNKQILTLNKDKAEIKALKLGKSAAIGQPNQNIQNAVFVGSGAELNKILADKLNAQI